MSGISKRKASKLRERIWRERRKEVRFVDFGLDFQKKWAADQVTYLRKQLNPEHRLRLQQGLAYWEAAVDSLEEDGVMPDPKGQE